LQGGPGAEFVVDAAAGDKFFVETAEGGGLEVVKLEFPVDDVADCNALSEEEYRSVGYFTYDSGCSARWQWP